MDAEEASDLEVLASIFPQIPQSTLAFVYRNRGHKSVRETSAWLDEHDWHDMEARTSAATQDRNLESEDYREGNPREDQQQQERQRQNTQGVNSSEAEEQNRGPRGIIRRREVFEGSEDGPRGNSSLADLPITPIPLAQSDIEHNEMEDFQQDEVYDHESIAEDEDEHETNSEIANSAVVAMTVHPDDTSSAPQRSVQIDGNVVEGDMDGEDDIDMDDEETFTIEEQDGDFLFFRPRKRVRHRVCPTPESKSPLDAPLFWVRFDDRVMLKSFLELLNISLKSSAHKSVGVLNTRSHLVDKAEATRRLLRWSRNAITQNPPQPYFGDSTSSPRQALEDAQNPALMGYWSHFFDNEDLDEVWRAMVSAHLANRAPFGDYFEIRTCRGTGQNETQEAFDTLHAISRVRRGAICVVLPCPQHEPTIAVMGAALCKALILRQPVYYRHRTSEEQIMVHVCDSETCCPVVNDSAPYSMPMGENCAKLGVCSRFYDFFDVLSRDEHHLASQYKLTPNRPDSVAVADSNGRCNRLPGGSFRLRPPNFQHGGEPHQLFRVQGIRWLPV